MFEYSANMITSKGEPIFAHVNMHGFRWKLMAPSSSRARNSVMKIAERLSLKILPSPNTNCLNTCPKRRLITYPPNGFFAPLIILLLLHQELLHLFFLLLLKMTDQLTLLIGRVTGLHSTVSQLTINMLHCFKDYKRYIQILNRILDLALYK